MRVTRLAGSERITSRFVSDGRRASTVADDGTTTPLASGVAEQLAVAGAAGGEGLGALGLRISEWFRDPAVRSSGGLDTISGDLDVAAVLVDLTRMLRGAGAELSREEAERVADTARAATGEVVTSRENRLLRRVELRFAFDLPSRLRKALSAPRGVAAEFSLDIEKPNEAVSTPDLP